jgi:hypothetical protein
MCNNEYAYAALESEIRIKAISDGYDPTIGIMHEGSDGSSKFIFDLMEPERPKVDRAVLDFVKGYVFDPAILSFAPTVFAGLIQKWRGWSWRRFLHRKSSTPTGRSRRKPDIALAAVNVGVGRIARLRGSPWEGPECAP